MLHKVRSKYIYFKNFMVRKRDVAISVAVLLLVVLGGVYLYVDNYQPPEDKEIEGIMTGKTRDMGGAVQSVDYHENEFVLRTLRPSSGEYKDYTIHVDRDTEFIFRTEETVEVPNDDFEFESVVEHEQRVHERPASFGDVKTSVGVVVSLDERVDVDNAWRLVAKTVKIIKQTNNEEKF